jgi:hypothetical protein
MKAHRHKLVRQHIVFHLKLIEVLHLSLLSIHLEDSGVCPDNELSHGVPEFKETLLGTTVSLFMSLCDNPKQSTNARTIWKQLYPNHAKAIDRIWDRRITPGESVMKLYRDKAGVHGDDLDQYINAKVSLIENKQLALNAMDAFYRLSIRLLKRQAKELPEFNSEIEGVLLDTELRFPNKSFNRGWLRKMRLIESGPFTKKFS